MIFLRRCPKCERENWAMAVATGQCCWCGYKATKEDCVSKDVWETKDDNFLRK